MRKIIIIVLIILGIYLLSNKDDEIRFRVISNSNDKNDILMKEKVVNELSSTLFISGSKKKIKENIKNNLDNIDHKINKLFKDNSYSKDYSISYGFNYFPEKIYNNKTYSEGEYESLVIKIGKGEGNNYWCFLYPSLCLADSSEKEVKIKFKLTEIIKGLFS